MSTTTSTTTPVAKRTAWDVILGLLLVAAGLAMLFLPGQGLLTVLIGVCVMDFPGKRGLLQRLVRGPKVQGALNWIRRKRGKEPFVFRL